MPLDELAPCPIAERLGPLRRTDDVREQDGREHTVELRLLCLDCRQEALGLGDHRIAVAHERSVLVAVKLDKPGPGDPRRHVPGMPDVEECVVHPANHEGRHLHRREHGPTIDLEPDPLDR